MRRFQPLLLAAMMTCIVVPMVVIAETFAPDWQGTYVLAVVPIAVLEGIWSKRIYQRERLSGAALAWKLVAEAVVLMLTLKLLSYIGRGLQSLLDDLASWIQNPSMFLTMDFVFLLPLVIGIWSISQKLHTDFNCLSDPSELGQRRDSARESIRGFILFGAFWLLAASGFILGMGESYFSLSRGSSILIEAAVICYLGLSLLVLAHMQYLRRQIEWSLEGLSVPDVITRRWARWGFALVIAIFLIAALLPAAYNYGPEQLIVMILNVLFFFSQILMTLLIFIFSPCMWLLGLVSEDSSLPELPTTEPLEIPTPTTPNIPLWWIDLRQVFQYILIATLLAIVFITYFKNRALSVPSLRAILPYLKKWLHSAWLWFQGLLRGAQATIKTIRKDRSHPSQIDRKGPSKRWSLLHAITARARVRRYYFSLLRRASEAGLHRTPQQTPQEYAAELTPKLPDQRDELEVLTDAFICARYDTKEIDEGDVSLVRKAWYTIRDILRQSSA